MKQLIGLAILTFLLIAPITYAQNANSLRQKIAHIVKDKSATIGVAVEGSNGKNTLSFNGTKRFPMQSVFKFPVALVVLNDIDRGKLSLNQNIDITKDDLDNDLYSPIRDKYPNGVSVFVADTKENEDVNKKIVADISKAVWNYFMKK